MLILSKARESMEAAVVPTFPTTLEAQ